jgi:ribosomal protein S18 acetylase RimI-like enzyme
MSHPLDRSIWHALSHRHAAFSIGNATALRYRTEYAPFAATLDNSSAGLSALYHILPPDDGVALFTPESLEFPPVLSILRRALVTQMILHPNTLAAGTRTLPPTTRPLSRDDMPAMTTLVELTQPGPFAARTVELGRFLGVFEGGSLIAMAGERMCLDGFVEISGVCTHPNHRGKSLSAALIATLVRAAFDRAETPFLHAYADNTPALAVYRRLGFVVRATLHLAIVGRAEDAT